MFLLYIHIFFNNSENFKLKYFSSEDNLFLCKESLSHSCIIFSLLLELFNVKNINYYKKVSTKLTFNNQFFPRGYCSISTMRKQILERDRKVINIIFQPDILIAPVFV